MASRFQHQLQELHQNRRNQKNSWQGTARNLQKVIYSSTQRVRRHHRTQSCTHFSQDREEFYQDAYQGAPGPPQRCCDLLLSAKRMIF